MTILDGKVSPVKDVTVKDNLTFQQKDVLNHPLTFSCLTHTVILAFKYKHGNHMKGKKNQRHLIIVTALN